MALDAVFVHYLPCAWIGFLLTAGLSAEKSVWFAFGLLCMPVKVHYIT